VTMTLYYIRNRYFVNIIWTFFPSTSLFDFLFKVVYLI
jgi:hypothetical protein